MIRFSRNLAVIIGTVAPLLETYRRWSTWQRDPPSLFDDYILGALLLFGAWQVTRNAKAGQKYLTAGWGFALGMVYCSFFFQLRMIDLGEQDPSGFSNQTAVVVKGLGFLIVIAGFIMSLAKISDAT
jgi:hypothetical protein